MQSITGIWILYIYSNIKNGYYLDLKKLFQEHMFKDGCYHFQAIYHPELAANSTACLL